MVLRMNWRTLITVFVILSLVGLLLASKEQTKKYTDFFRDRIGRFIDVIKGVKPPSGKELDVEVITTRDILKGIDLKLKDSSIMGEFSIGMLVIDGKKI